MRLLDDDLRAVLGPLRCALAIVDLPLLAVRTREKAQAMTENRNRYYRNLGQRALELMDEGRFLPTHYAAPLGLWQFGDDLTLVALSGETVVDYVALTEKTLGPLNLWVAGYCNDVFGYLPSARILKEGGYETRGLYHGGVGLFSPAVDQTVADALRNLAKLAGRGLPKER